MKIARDVGTYGERLKRHLTDYRWARLGVKARGTFQHKGKELHYGYILPSELKWLNILEPYRKEIREYMEARKSLTPHRYFHHLNSSQAFALNLFIPFLLNDRQSLATAFGCEAIESFQPERVQDISENTNVDMWWKAASGVATHCEVKLSEGEFGLAKNDNRHQEKLSGTYYPLLAGKLTDDALKPDEFFANYQIYRYLWLASCKGNERDQVCFLLPKANAGLVRRLQHALKAVHAQLRTRVKVVYIEPLLERLAGGGELGWYAKLLQEKYIPG
jgi:hypothetical protein